MNQTESVKPTPMHVPLVNGGADLDRNLVEIAGQTHKLSPNESRLFRYLVERASQTVEQAELLREVFGYAEQVQSRTVITTMQRLRKKVEEDPAAPVHLLSVFGRGYRFEPLGEGAGLVGRSEQLAHLRRSLASGHLWLVAPGGYGKTALAFRHAELTAPDPVIVDLTGVSSPEELISAMCRALGIGTIETPDALALAVQHRAPSLLVLDAAEDLGEQLVPFVNAWSGSVPVLVTSRVPCEGEPSLELGPLAPDDAERLFARSLSRPIEPERLAPLLARLNGIPLALELAAAQLALFALEDLDPHLDDLGRLLVGGEGRHSSMEAVLGWSWERTSDEDRAALCALTPARQGLTIQDATELVGAPDLSRLSQLQRWGWIRIEGGRVHMLDPVRQYIEGVSDLEGCQSAHRAMILRRAQEHEEDLLVGRGRAFLDAEAGNLRAALASGWEAGDAVSVELALLLVPTMGQRVPMVEALRWLDEAEAIATGGLLGDVLVLRAALWMSRASLDAAEADLERAQANGVRNDGLLALRWGRWHQEKLQMKASRDHLRRAVEALEDPWGLSAELALAYTLLRSGDEEEAHRRLRVVLARSRVQEAPGMTLIAQGTLGVLFTARDDFVAAQTALDESLRIAQDIGYDLVSAKVHTQLGGLALYQGRPDDAERHWTAARQMSVRLGSPVGAAMAEVNIAGLRLVGRDLAEAERLLQSARSSFEESGVVPGMAYAALGLGRLALLRRAWSEAEGWFDRCGDLPAHLAWFLGVERCILWAEQGDLARARAALARGGGAQ